MQRALRACPTCRSSVLAWFADRTDGKFDILLSKALKASSALIFLSVVVAFSMILYVAYVGRHPGGSRKKIRKEHAVVAGFVPKYGRLASECLEKSEEFFNSLCLEAEGATLQLLEAHCECLACVSSSAFAC